MSALLWIWVPGAPLLVSLVLFRHPRWSTKWLWLSCLPALLLSAWPPPALPLPALWPGAQWAAEDAVSRAWLAFSALLWACATRFAMADPETDAHQRRFWVFWLLALTGNLLLVIALDAISFYAGFTLMSLSAYGLVAHLPGSEARRAARLYLQLAILSEMLVFAGILLRVHEVGGVLTLAQWHNIPVSGLTASLLLLGFGLKAGFWPLHVWLPQAHPAAPAAASAALSGAMIKAGILGLWRFLPADNALLQQGSTGLLIVGAISALYGVLLGLLQTRVKTVLAYSSVSQVGYLLIILALAWQQPDYRDAAALLLMLYAVHHGLAKGALFLGAGLSARVRLGLGHWLLMLLPTLALAGLPLTSGAVVKGLLKEGVAISAVASWATLLIGGSVGTALLMLRALWLMHASQKQTALLPAVPTGQLLPWVLLCLMPILLPWLWVPTLQPPRDNLSWYTLWTALWPLLVALLLAGLATRAGWHLPLLLRRLPDPAQVCSLRLKYWLRPRPPRDVTPWLKRHDWRRCERRWNRLWQSGTVAASVWIMALLMLLGWF